MNFTAVSGASTDAAPAIAFTGIPNETPYALVWKELGGKTVWYSTCGAALNWTTPVQIMGQDDEGNPWVAETDHGPAVTQALGPTIFESDDQVINPVQLVYVAWTGKSGKIWYSTSPDGQNWSPQATVPEAETGSSPSLTTIGGAATVAWMNNNAISSISFPSGVDPWRYTVDISGMVSTGFNGVAVGPSQDSIPVPIFVWRKDSDDTLWYADTDEQIPAQLAGEGFVALSSHVPSFNSSGAGLAWKGRSEHVWFDKYFPASQWDTDPGGANQINDIQQEIPGALTNHAPAWVGMQSPPNWEFPGPLVFVAYNVIINGFHLVNGQLISCIP